MNKIIKAKWIAALTSGDYKQAREALAYTRPSGAKSYCCLGVLCDIYQKEHPDSSAWGNKRLEHQDDFQTTKGVAGELNYPPAHVLSWAGIGDAWATSLAADNDHGKTFADISFKIEKSL